MFFRVTVIFIITQSSLTINPITEFVRMDCKLWMILTKGDYADGDIHSHKI